MPTPMASGRGATWVNTGNLTVLTETPVAGATTSAYGIYVLDDGTLTNTGRIRVDGDTAYEVYITDGHAVTLVDDYRVTLDGDPNVGSIYVGAGSTLDLNDSHLAVDGLVGETLWDTEYRLFELDPNGAD